MGGLAHYFEEEGLSTIHISLIREHTQTIKPPRALWVPFELGRPFGAPNDPAFQTRVLKRVLELLNAENGPVLDAFPEDAPVSGARAETVACPISFVRTDESMGAADQMLFVFKQEMAQMRNWYDMAVKKRGRTTSGATGLAPEEVAEFLSAFIQGDQDTSPMENVSLATAIRMAAEDLQAYYLEAVTAQPGQPTDSETLARWFWSETQAARVINAVREICLKTPGGEFRLLGKLLLIPVDQMHYFQG